MCALLVGCATALRADLTSPAVAQTIPAPTLAQGGNATINLYSYINDPNVTGTAVRMTVKVGTLGTGNIDLALTDTLTPITVANFLAYISAGAYGNNIIHRSDPGGVTPPVPPATVPANPGFVIQGGGYAFVLNGTVVELDAVPTFSPIQNEVGLSNVRGTIAMAKTSAPNSATSQWFINLSDSNTFLDSPSETSGPFTAFGKVLGSGMQIADIVSELQINNYGGALSQLPLTANVVNNTGNFVLTNMAVVPAVTYTANSSNVSLVTVSLSGNTLTLIPSATNTGTANITVTTTDLEGGQLQTSFNVTVLKSFGNWVAPFNLSVNAALATANPSGDGVPNLLKFAFGGNPTLATRAPGLPLAESGGGVEFYQRQLSGLSYEVDESPDLVNWTKIWQTSDGLSAAVVAMHTSITGFDVITIRDPAPATLRFWRVRVTQTL